MTFLWHTIGSGGRTAERTRRVPVDLPSTLIVGDERVAATALALSCSGVHLRLSKPVAVGEKGELELGEAGVVKVRISWSTGREAGAVFLDLQ